MVLFLSAPFFGATEFLEFLELIETLEEISLVWSFLSCQRVSALIKSYTRGIFMVPSMN